MGAEDGQTEGSLGESSDGEGGSAVGDERGEPSEGGIAANDHSSPGGGASSPGGGAADGAHGSDASETAGGPEVP